MFSNQGKCICLALASLSFIASSLWGQSQDVGSASKSDPEQQLLEKIDRLEKRVAELESRAGNSQSFQPDSTSAKISTAIAPTEKSHGADEADSKSSEAAAPFAFADFTWLNGNSRTHDSPLDSTVFTGEFRADISYIDDFNHPQDHTLVGTTESGRTGEFQVQQLGIGGDFHYGNARGRVMTQFGMYSTMTPRNDASPGRGQWDLADAYRYLSEAYGGYHFDVMHGINVDAGIFMSYVGLFSYYNFDNWAYQPSYVSSNTPWFLTVFASRFFPRRS